MFTSVLSPCLNSGVTLAHFQSSGNIAELRDLLKMLHRGVEIRSAHSRISLAEMLLRPIALDVDSLFERERALVVLILVGLKQPSR